MKILMVLTSHDQLGNTGKKTGFWLEEFAAPYFTFLDAGVDITVCSPKGGQPPLDPKSDTPEGKTELTERFKGDAAAQRVLANTARRVIQRNPRLRQQLVRPLAAGRRVLQRVGGHGQGAARIGRSVGGWGGYTHYPHGGYGHGSDYRRIRTHGPVVISIRPR